MNSLYTRFVLLCIFIACIYSNSHVQSNAVRKNELQALFVLHRHGDRSISVLWPTDTYANPEQWPEGYGRLTIEGKRRMYFLGRRLRRTYGPKFFDKALNAYARSSPSPRCLDSAMLLLNGLYPLDLKERWLVNNEWQSFPVYSKQPEEEGMLIAETPCKLADEELHKKMNSEEMQQLDKDNQDLYKLLSEKTGLNVSNLLDVEAIYDTLLVERQSFLPNPDWYTGDVVKRMTKMHELAFITPYSTFELQRYRTGLFFNDVKEKLNYFKNNLNSQNVASQSSPKPEWFTSGAIWPGSKVFIYSTHDTTVAPVLAALEQKVDQPPPYGSSIFFELWKDTVSGNLFVKANFLQDTREGVQQPILLESCGRRPECTLEEFEQTISKFAFSDWKGVCNGEIP